MPWHKFLTKDVFPTPELPTTEINFPKNGLRDSIGIYFGIIITNPLGLLYHFLVKKHLPTRSKEAADQPDLRYPRVDL